MTRVVYLHGFTSSPSSTKAQFFQRKFTQRGIEIEAPALDAGNFAGLTITGQLAVVARATRGEPATLMGSSLGGYLAALYAARYPEVENLVLLAPAFGFPRRWAESLGPERVADWKRAGKLTLYHYGARAELELGYQLMEDAARYEDWPDFSQPALILHGKADVVVPCELSSRFAAVHTNARLRLLESSHELTDVMEELWEATWRFLAANKRD